MSEPISPEQHRDQSWNDWVVNHWQLIDKWEVVPVLLARIEAAKALHQRDSVMSDYCAECSDFGTDEHPMGQLIEHPCATRRALTEGTNDE